VSVERQQEIDRLVTGKSFLQSKLSSPTHHSASKTDASSASDPSSSTGHKKDARPARIDSSSYNVVWSVLFLVEVILAYLDISMSFPLITSELISKIMELIRLFDHRTRQLVLGAQAIQSAARLKSISARHLAITAQSIDFLSSLLPHIRTAILAQLSPKHHIQLQECDRISTELLDHHSAIVAKFVSIVSDFMDSSAIKLRHVDWDRFQGQCEYFEEVIRNVSALHRVLVQLLPPELLQDIFQRIFSLLNRKIPTHFEEIMPNTQTGKQRILDDVSHVVTTFSRLKQIDCKAQVTQLEESFRKRYAVKEVAGHS
jgi:vacuolar protein sorting-associated protein 54